MYIMFCPNCGKQIPDNSAFCPECGKVMGAAPAPEPAPESAPVATPTIPVSKIKYFTKVAPQNKRILGYVALGLGLLCILLVFLSANNTVNGSMFDLPILSLIGVDDGDEVQKELDELVKEFKEADTDEIEEFLNEILEVPIRDVEGKRDEILDLLTPLSISSVIELNDKFGMSSSESTQALSTVVSVVWTFAAILMIITALGVLFQKTWIMVLSYILGVLFIVLTGGFVYFILATIAYIATAVLFSKMKFEYKVYTAACALGK